MKKIILTGMILSFLVAFNVSGQSLEPRAEENMAASANEYGVSGPEIVTVGQVYTYNLIYGPIPNVQWAPPNGTQLIAGGGYESYMTLSFFRPGQYSFPYPGYKTLIVTAVTSQIIIPDL